MKCPRCEQELAPQEEIREAIEELACEFSRPPTPEELRWYFREECSVLEPCIGECEQALGVE